MYCVSGTTARQLADHSAEDSTTLTTTETQVFQATEDGLKSSDGESTIKMNY